MCGCKGRKVCKVCDVRRLQSMRCAHHAHTTAEIDTHESDLPDLRRLECRVMCGRLPVGKGFLHVAGLVGAAMCSAC
jgi:hypothetical protein